MRSNTPKANLQIASLDDAEERQRLTVSQVAKLLQISPDKVRELIRTGELDAFNVANVGSKRPRIRVHPRDLIAWENRRKVEPRPKARPRRRRKVSKAVAKLLE